MNLLVNSIPAMSLGPGKGRRIDVITAIDGNGAPSLSVRDAGPGIPETILGQVFDGFFTTKPSGLGMGLRICSSIVRSHGGRIWAANNAEGGATFSFTVPLPSA